PNTSPAATSNDTSSTARTGPLGVRYSTRKFLTEKSGSGIPAPNYRRRETRRHPGSLQRRGPGTFRFQARVGHLVDREVHHDQREPDQRNRQARRDDGPPAFGQERLVV